MAEPEQSSPLKLLAVSGASGKTGWRVVQEALRQGLAVRALVRPESELPEGIEGAEVVRLKLGDTEALHRALEGCDALVIATGARPSVDLTGPLQVDALGVRHVELGLSSFEEGLQDGLRDVLVTSTDENGPQRQGSQGRRFQ